MEDSLVSPRFRFRYNVQLRQDLRSRIFAILQRKFYSTDAATLQAKLRTFSYHLEAKLVTLAKSEEEYSNLRDLEVRLHYIFKELKDRCSCGINALPDSLISQILLWLPTKDSAKTSVLSTRWRNMWLDVPGLDFDFTSITPPSSKAAAINNVIERLMESRLQTLKMKYDDSNVYLFGISNLITTVINRGVEHLDLESGRCWNITKDFTPLDLYKRRTLPLDIYKSKTLVSLKLGEVELVNPGFVVSLPCLKLMQLENVMCSNGDPLILEKLILGCPVLEDLTVGWGFGHNLPFLRVRSQTLKRFCVTSPHCATAKGVEIDAPGLKYMNFRNDLTDRVVVKNLKSLFMIDIDARFHLNTMKERVISDFLGGISGVRHMIISQPTLEVLHPYFKLGQVSKFRNLSRLEASFCNLLLQVLPDFLQSFPNLKHLTLYLVRVKDQEPENLKLTIVPRCLLSTLECVEIKEETGMKRARNGKKHQKKIRMEAVRYILENSLVLKKLVLCFSPVTIKVSEISKALDTFRKRSPKCEILICWTSL
uniref:Putative F-box/FBD/LRR-repeat protein n=2 Tax=Noccaea caerulescens TaxID=107243 RepID=A0A1J3EIC4_NOCCA